MQLFNSLLFLISYLNLKRVVFNLCLQNTLQSSIVSCIEGVHGNHKRPPYSACQKFLLQLSVPRALTNRIGQKWHSVPADPDPPEAPKTSGSGPLADIRSPVTTLFDQAQTGGGWESTWKEKGSTRAIWTSLSTEDLAADHRLLSKPGKDESSMTRTSRAT